MEKKTIVLAASSLLIGSLGFVGAQSSQGARAQTQSETQDAPQMQRGYGFGRGFGGGFGGGFGHGFGPGSGSGNDFGRGFGGLPFGRPLALGTTVTLEFYTADPAGNKATPEQTLTFTYGEDSEATFAESFAEARANASYVTANVDEQTQTLELPSADENRRGGLRGALPRGLSEGGTVEAVFYDGDPAGDAQTLETLTFTYAQDSEAGFAADFADAAETAAYVTVTTSPQTYTVDLSAVAEGRFRQHRGGHRR